MATVAQGQSAATAVVTEAQRPPFNSERPPQSRKRLGRLPRDPRPLVCTGCARLPRFRDGAAITCVCGAPPHPFAHYNLIAGPLTPEQLRAFRDGKLISESER